ncbi:hypothetical protein ACPPVU_03860 [Mucilaginibacter sp. McL0603]|uniref:hypothetical protein n=1 Tax=Mucilaginibacter sp. McL0603 TaxID=3415670 RepID=UPI003CE8D978
MNTYALLIKTRKVNAGVTQKVIDLHHQGYVFDFYLSDHQKISCLQDNQCFSFDNVEIEVIDQVYDQFSRSFKYIHTIKTWCGAMGLLLTDTICFVGTA